MQYFAVDVAAFHVAGFRHLRHDGIKLVRRALAQGAVLHVFAQLAQVCHVLRVLLPEQPGAGFGMEGDFRRALQDFQRKFCHHRRPAGDFAVGRQLRRRLATRAAGCLYACPRAPGGQRPFPAGDARAHGVVSGAGEAEGQRFGRANHRRAGARFVADVVHQLPVGEDVRAAFVLLCAGGVDALGQGAAVLHLCRACANHRRPGHRAACRRRHAGRQQRRRKLAEALRRHVGRHARVGRHVFDGIPQALLRHVGFHFPLCLRRACRDKVGQVFFVFR